MGTIVVVDGIMFPYSSNVDLNAPSTTVFTTTLADNCTRIVLTVYDGFKQKDLNSPVVQRDIANVTKMAILDIAGGFSFGSFTIYFHDSAADYDDELFAMFFILEMDLCAVTYDIYDTLLGIFRNRNEEIADAFASRWAAMKGIDAEDIMASIYLPIQITTEPPAEVVSWWEPYMTPFGFLVLFVMLSWFVLGVSAYIHMKWKKHDDINFVAVLMYGLYAWDVFSDIFFASDIWFL